MMQKLIILLTLCLFLYAKDSILSSDKEMLFEYEKQKVIEDVEKLRLDWINPVMLQYTQEEDRRYYIKKSSVSINQPIFKSGGIYSAVKYADAMEIYSTLSIEARRKALIKDATVALFGIKKLQLQIAKQKKLLENNQIRYDITKEGVGLNLSSTTKLYELDIELDSNKKLISDLNLQLNDLISKFKTISDKPYNSLKLPKLKLISKSEFEAKNINLKIDKSNIDSKNYLYSMTVSNYLPTLNLFYNYTKRHESNNPIYINKDENSYRYGFSISIPLDIKSVDLIQSNRVSYLKSKLNYIDKQKTEREFFENRLNRIESIKEKEQITKNSIESYRKIVKEYKLEYESRLKTRDDVTLYQNLKTINEYDLEIYDIDKQIELLEIYARVG